jgi:guanylate kinase
MNKIKIVALFGPAGSGKDYLVKKVINGDYIDKNKISEIISQTTRPKRDNERDGVDYYFKTENDFLLDIQTDRLLEWTYFREWYYGTNLNSLKEDKINIGVFNITGIKALLKDERIEVYPVFIKASDKVRLIRQLSRERNPDIREIFRRYEADEQDFFNTDFSYEVIYNEGYNDAELELANFVNSL